MAAERLGGITMQLNIAVERRRSFWWRFTLSLRFARRLSGDKGANLQPFSIIQRLPANGDHHQASQHQRGAD